MERLHRSPMVGRDEQLATLRRVVAAAWARDPTIAVVEGEAGIGKTRLLAELATDVSGTDTLVLWGNCSPVAGRDLALGPILDALGDLHRALGAVEFASAAGGWRPVLGRLVPDLMPAPAMVAPPSRDQMYGAIVGLLREVSSARRILLLIEDVHWADESSRDVLEYLARSVRDETLALVLTARTDDPAFEGIRGFLADVARLPVATRVALPRLSRHEVAEQVRGLRHGASEPTVDLDHIIDFSGGVPFLVEELVAASGAHVGDVAERLLGHRISRLPTAARSVVESTALAIGTVEVRDLAAASPLTDEAFDQGFAAAVSSGVLVRHRAVVEFRHTLLREATLSRILPHTCQELHHLWAELLSRQPAGLAGATAVAHHRIGADETELALDACLRAVELARQVSAYPEQVRMLRRAAELWPRVAGAEQRTGIDLAAVLTEAAEAAHLGLARPEETLAFVRQARNALPADAPARSGWLDIIQYWSTHYAQQHTPAEQVVSAVQAIPAEPATRQHALACETAVSALLHAGRPEDAIRFAQDALDAARRLGDRVLGAGALKSRALVESSLGHHRDAVDAVAESVRLADATGDLKVRQGTRMALAILSWAAGDDPGSARTSREAVDLLGGDRPGPMPAEWGLHCANLAEALVALGKWDEAERVLERVLAVDELPPWIRGSAERVAVHLALWRGEPSDWFDWDWPDRLAGLTLEDADVQDLVQSDYTWADVCSQHHRLEAARALVRAVMAEDRARSFTGGLFPLLAVAARTEADVARTGEPDPDPEQGRWIADRAANLLAQTPPRNTRDQAYAAQIAADLARITGDDDPAMWLAVVDAWRRTPLPHPLGWALLRFGHAAASAGQVTQARQALEQAIVIGEQLGARPLVEAALAAGRRGHLRLASRIGDQSPTLGLTTRELEVLHELADGVSNAAIGERLFISHKTVSVHVSHILDKLGAKSRGEATAIARRKGLIS